MSLVQYKCLNQMLIFFFECMGKSRIIAKKTSFWEQSRGNEQIEDSPCTPHSLQPNPRHIAILENCATKPCLPSITNTRQKPFKVSCTPQLFVLEFRGKLWQAFFAMYRIKSHRKFAFFQKKTAIIKLHMKRLSILSYKN